MTFKTWKKFFLSKEKRFKVHFLFSESIQWHREFRNRIEAQRQERARRDRIEASKRQWSPAPTILETTAVATTSTTAATTTTTTSSALTELKGVNSFANQSAFLDFDTSSKRSSSSPFKVILYLKNLLN